MLSEDIHYSDSTVTTEETFMSPHRARLLTKSRTGTPRHLDERDRWTVRKGSPMKEEGHAARTFVRLAASSRGRWRPHPLPPFCQCDEISYRPQSHTPRFSSSLLSPLPFTRPSFLYSLPLSRSLAAFPSRPRRYQHLTRSESGSI